MKKSKSKSMSGKQILAIIGLVIAILWTLKFVFKLSSSGVKEVPEDESPTRDYSEAPRSRSGKNDLTDELDELQALYEDGTLSEAQFKKAKKKILG